MRTALIEALAKPVPRYTSYPTAVQFTEGVGADTYARWLGELPAGLPLSLYCHIPFCHSLCRYCGCNTKATRRYEPLHDYLGTLSAEIASVGARVGAGHSVREIHWGGGSPNILDAADMERLAEMLRVSFDVAPDAAFAVEIDPRHFVAEQAAAFKRMGVTRVSIGVQDFDPAVQAAIDRLQSIEQTRQAIDLCRAAGIHSINIDLIYGLPHQTRSTVSRTVADVIALQPDRIAVFGYAHLPRRFAHQRLIPEAALPDVRERYGQSSRIARLLKQAGYARVGIDHFARGTDELAHSAVRRNFQGYTTDAVDTLIGLGASAIGKLPQGFVQNATATADYTRRIGESGLAVVRGRALTDDDRMRAHVIERLMCDLTFDAADLSERFGTAASDLINEAAVLAETNLDGLIEPDERGFRISEAARPFTRSICSVFDAYLDAGVTRHSSGI